MRPPRKPLLGLLLAVAAAAMSPAHAGDNVPYVPTPEVVVDAMLLMGEVDAQDNLVDLGSGDGRIVITAARKYGARAVGVEYNPELVERSRENAAREGVSDRVTILQQDLFVTDISQATVVTMYLLPAVNLQLRPRILSELRPGTRVVSHDFHMGDWKPDGQREVEATGNSVAWFRDSEVFLWIVPARVAGRWSGTLEGPDGREPLVIEFTQRYQEITASGTFPGGILEGSGRVRGESIALQLDRTSEPGSAPLRFDLKAKEGFMEGEGRNEQEWHRYRLRAIRSTDNDSRALREASGAPKPEAPRANPIP